MLTIISLSIAAKIGLWALIIIGVIVLVILCTVVFYILFPPPLYESEQKKIEHTVNKSKFKFDHLTN